MLVKIVFLMLVHLQSHYCTDTAHSCSKGDTDCDVTDLHDSVFSQQHLDHHPEGTLPSETCPGVKLERPVFSQEPQAWQQVEDRKVMVFSAFVDHRPEVQGPAIRIIGTGWQEQFNEIGDLYCQLWYEKIEKPELAGPAKYIRIYPSTLHPEMWVSHFVLCPLKSDRKEYPYAVSVTPTPCSVPQNSLMVLGRDPPDVTNTHALCISPLYNYFKNWTMISEWFEIHSLLGASEMTIYSFMVTEDAKKVLEYYRKESDLKVNVIQWPYPTEHQSNVFCQRGALNDCLYRMGLKHKYVTITDLDEILVPREYDSWPELMKKIDTEDRGAYLFQHAYFQRNYTGDEPYLVTQQSLWRTDEVVPPGKIRCKSMYKASKAVKIDLHFPYELVAGAKEYILPPEEGMLHHYRFQPMETFQKNPEKYHYIEDRYMQRYGKELTRRVKEVINKL